MGKKKKMSIIVTIITLILIITISTTALWKWTSSNTNVGFTISGLDAFIIYNKGSDVLTGVLDPVSSYSDSSVSTEITLYKNTSKTLYGHIYLDVTSIGTNIANEPAVKWVITSNGEVLNEGNFVGSSVDASIPLKINIPLSTTEQKFQIYIWLDESMDINDSIEGETLSTIVRAEASEVEYVTPGIDNSGANYPDLVEGMIPVMYDGTKLVKANITSSTSTYGWYDYDEKKWANAVLVSSTNRDTYKSAAPGTEVVESDVLAYYVWIPRYKYKVWNINKVIGTDSYNAQHTGIDIVFENGTKTTGTITCNNYSFATPTSTSPNETCVGSNGDYYTHPAFWWDMDGDGTRETNEEIRGIWVGKFEVSEETSNNTDETSNDFIRIKPNMLNWTTYPSTYSSSIQAMGTSSTYGLNSETTYSHMLKNMEWGAVTYLTNSDYGRCSNGACKKVTINNSLTTGKAANIVLGGTNVYNEMKTVTKIKEGTGTDVPVTKTDDTTYPWIDTNGILSSSNNGVNESTSTLTYTFTLTQKGAISLDYAVSSENVDKLTIKLDDITLVNSNGATHGTEEKYLNFDNLTAVVDSGEHTLTISYAKNKDYYRGLDKAYIKNLKVLETPEIVEIIEPASAVASTTGNIYGIYDMVGGGVEYVMGNMSSASGSYTYYPNNSSSGALFSYNDTTAKYMDTYAYGTSYNDQTAYNRAKLGDATGEVVASTDNYGGSYGGWHSSYAGFVKSSAPWFERGGYYCNYMYAGLFFFDRNEGTPGYSCYCSSGCNRSARAALLKF